MTSKNNIASERMRVCKTREQLARMLGVAKSTVDNWETGRCEPAGSNLKKMARIFGCSIDYLLGVTDERLPTAALRR